MLEQPQHRIQQIIANIKVQLWGKVYPFRGAKAIIKAKCLFFLFFFRVNKVGNTQSQLQSDVLTSNATLVS